MKNIPLFLFLLLQTAVSMSQVLYEPRNIAAAYEKGTRHRNGLPGDKYWQNTAAYDIRVSFDPSTGLLQGTEDVTYTNNSPDTLSNIIFKLYPNYYKKGAPRAKDINPEDVSEGMKVKSVMFNGKGVAEKDFVIESTNMFVKVTVTPGQTVRFFMEFSYVLNRGSHNRTGRVDDGSFFIAYFFPRITVYDDIDGWNLYPYTGSYEFYHDFCDFKLAVRLPSQYIVWATGDHVNRNEVFSSKYMDRILKAESQDSPVTVIDSADITGKDRVTRGGEFNQWKFAARNVTDIAFALSDHYMWQSTSLVVDSVSKRRTRVDAVFNPVHKDYFMVLADAAKTIECMSYRFPKWPFPFSHETVFDGLDQMEYPMMANDNPVEDRAESIELTDHEIFHTMFPFYMGINETKYGWMDEGWATIGEWLISPMIDSTLVDQYGLARYERSAGNEVDGNIMQLTPGLVGEGFFLNSYPKPALGYLYVKDMLGDDLFFKALHYYIREWNGKHPMPLDFFNCMNAGSGKNLNWFWKKWFFEPGVPDLAIADVIQSGSSKKVIIAMKGNKPVPVDITVSYEGGGKESFHKDISAWQEGNQQTVFSFDSNKSIKSVNLGTTYTVDTDRSNNTYTVK